ncbi:Rho termination factor N-terminal domain-containing protein [Virgibacillus siamensis]|uniref:Rho termination factor N-terminal domain-containing protein n=1 Tax=Virgibacillus siamensis TaxID=480071 RepID=UPI00158F5089|nr:Rho termination factor N-terminal domain-containing protein [Virgibacillus siamensis]
MSNNTGNKELEKGMLRALDGLKEMRDDMEKKEAERIWRDINVPISLYDALSRLTKDELTEIRKKLDIKNASSLKKEELIKLLQQVIPTQFENICLKLDSERYSIVEKIIQQGGSIHAEHLPLNILQNLGTYGLAFTGTSEGEKVAVIPDELVNAFSSINSRNVKVITSRNTEWIRLTHGLLYYYGVLTTSKLIDMVKTYTAYEVDTLEFLTVIYDAKACYKEMRTYRDILSHIGVFDAERVIDEHKSREDIPYFPFSKTQLITAGVPDYVERSKCFKQFVKFLTSHYDLTIEEAEGHVDECVHAINNGITPQDTLQTMQYQFEFEGYDDVKLFMDQLVDLSNNTKQWGLKGYSPYELHQLGNDNLQPSQNHASNVIDFQSGKKISRNDPCPCGSGKKYKKCCGR